MSPPEPFDYISLLLGENRDDPRATADRTDETPGRESRTPPTMPPTEPTKPHVGPFDGGFVGFVGRPDGAGPDFDLDALGRIPTVATPSVPMVAVAAFCYGPVDDPYVDYADFPVLWVLPDGSPVFWDSSRDRTCTLDEIREYLTVPPEDPGHGGVAIEIVSRAEAAAIWGDRLIDRALARYRESCRRWMADRGSTPAPDPEADGDRCDPYPVGGQCDPAPFGPAPRFDLAAWAEQSRRLHAIPQTDLSAIAGGFVFTDPGDIAEAEARRLEKGNLL